MKIDLSKIWPFRVTQVTKRQLTVIQKNEFKICQPAIRERSEYFGFRKKTLLIHLTKDGEWNCKII